VSLIIVFHLTAGLAIQVKAKGMVAYDVAPVSAHALGGIIRLIVSNR
jgi:hypothetical protein